ncbi:hypothetical protein ACROYT_G042450 [Oculina patagonica]
MEEQSRNSALSIKQRNCAQRNSLLKHTNQKISASIQSEHNQFERSMNFEAKKLRKKLMLMIPNPANDTRTSSTKEENSEENGQHKLKLPAIKNEPNSAPCSPTLGHRKSHFTWNNLSVSPSSPIPMPRRGSYNDISDSPRNSPILSRKMSRSFSHRDRRPTLVPLSPPSPGTEDGSGRISPALMPRNLKLRDQARRESVLKASLAQNEIESPQSPTLEDQFKSLGTCRYLRRATLEAVKITPADEEKDGTQQE